MKQVGMVETLVFGTRRIAWLHEHAAEVFKAYSRRFHRANFPVAILFDDEVLDAGGFGCVEDGVEVDDARADFGEALIGGVGHVFHV